MYFFIVRLNKFCSSATAADQTTCSITTIHKIFQHDNFLALVVIIVVVLS